MLLGRRKLLSESRWAVAMKLLRCVSILRASGAGLSTSRAR